MTGLYPEIEPYGHGMLEVGDGNLVYWETCGNPRGKPVVVLHGGPGSGCTDWHRRLFAEAVLQQRSGADVAPQAARAVVHGDTEQFEKIERIFLMNGGHMGFLHRHHLLSSVDRKSVV